MQEKRKSSTEKTYFSFHILNSFHAWKKVETSSQGKNGYTQEHSMKNNRKMHKELSVCERPSQKEETNLACESLWNLKYKVAENMSLQLKESYLQMPSFPIHKLHKVHACIFC